MLDLVIFGKDRNELCHAEQTAAIN